MDRMQDNEAFLQAIAFILGIAAVCYSVITTCVESRAMDLEAQRVEDSELLPYRPEFFHAIFGLASAYLCMLYISWNLDTLPSLSGDGKFQVGQHKTSPFAVAVSETSHNVHTQ